MKLFHILHMYPNEMNIYGDRGNLITLRRRASLHGFEPIVHYHEPGDKLPKDVHIVLGGGGQDSAQSDIQTDILRIGDELTAMAEAGVAMIMICGMYQLLCHRFVTQTGEEIKGIGLFDAETIAGSKRMVGNVAVDTPDLGRLYGFENHSGRTNLAQGQEPLGTVVRGGGNNDGDGTEGARLHNVFGTYLHGPVLPNNPTFADELIRRAATTVYGAFEPQAIDDTLAELARAGATSRRY